MDERVSESRWHRLWVPPQARRKQKAVVAMLEKALPLGRLGVWDGVLFVEDP